MDGFVFTPAPGQLPNVAVQKKLVVIFVIDASTSMANGRIGAVNNALNELKYKLSEFKSENSLDLQVAVMSFASSARWEIGLTPVEELNINEIKTRPGLTQYGAVFYELNKVLTKEKFMSHDAKIAPPAIMFLTDGKPDDDYSYDLDVLLKNAWFTNASRSAVLIGDAIYDDAARKAVSRIVKDVNKDIIAVEEATQIIAALEIATLHTIAGDPSNGVQSDGGNGNQNDTTGPVDWNIPTVPNTDPIGDPFPKNSPQDLNFPMGDIADIGDVVDTPATDLSGAVCPVDFVDMPAPDTTPDTAPAFPPQDDSTGGDVYPADGTDNPFDMPVGDSSSTNPVDMLWGSDTSSGDALSTDALFGNPGDSV